MKDKVSNRNCAKCETYIPYVIRVDGKKRNLKNRRFCLTCSPFLGHNTKKLDRPDRPNDHKSTCEVCNKDYFYSKRKGNTKKRCASCLVTESRRRKKDKLVKHAGGQCVLCGYDKSHYALSFHHKDPNKKDFSLSTFMSNGIEKLKKEADKCILVCLNCHARIHGEKLDLEKLDL